jgi:hypothetical protein
MTKPKTHKKKRVFRKNKKGVSRRMKYQTGGAPLTKEEIHKMVTGIYQQLGGNTAAGLGAAAVVYSYFAPAQAGLATSAASNAIQQFMSGLGGAMGEDISAFIAGLSTTGPNALVSTYQVIYDVLTRCPMVTVAVGASVITGTVVHRYHDQIVERLGQLRNEAGIVGGNIRDDPLYLLTYIISLLYCIQREGSSPVVAVAQATADYITESTLSAAYQISAVASALARGATGLSSLASNAASSIRRRVVSGGQVLLGLLDNVSTMGNSCRMPGAAAAPATEGLDSVQMDEIVSQIEPSKAREIYSRNISDVQQLINAQWLARVGSAPRLSEQAAREARASARSSAANRREQLLGRDARVAALTPPKAAGPASSFTFSPVPIPYNPFGPYGAPPSVPAPTSSVPAPTNSMELEEGEIDETEMDEEKGGKSKKRRRSHKKRV